MVMSETDTGDPIDQPIDQPIDAAAENETQPEKPKSPTRLVLVRHAVTAQTGPLLSGRMPGIDLSEKGVGQAEAAAQRLAKLPVAAVYASPIERTTQTAQQIAAHHALEVLALPGVIEADYGDWTGGKISDLAKSDEWKVVQVAPSRARFPNGESITEMQARMVAALDEVVARHPHETVVVVSHADPIKSAIAHYSGMHLDLFQRVHVSPASVTVFDFHAYGVMLVKCNDTGGLDDLLPEPEQPEPEQSGAEASDAAATA
jgi:probable phosphomutase (TIGR03848 family)